MDKHQKWSSSESQNSSNSSIEESIDQTKDPSENFSDLCERLNVEDKHESKSTKAIEQCNVSQEVDCQNSRSELLSKQSCLKKMERYPYESDPTKHEMSTRTVDMQQFSSSKQRVISKNSAGTLRPPFCSQGSESRISHSDPNIKHFPSPVNAPNLSGYQPIANSAIMRPIFPPNIMIPPPNLQIQLSNIRTAAQPFLPPCFIRNTVFNAMPPIRTNTVPDPYVRHSSQNLNPMPIIKKNENPKRYSERVFRNRKQMPPTKPNAETIPQIQSHIATTPDVSESNPSLKNVMQSKPHDQPSKSVATKNVSDVAHKSDDATQSGVESTPKISDQVSALPSTQPQHSEFTKREDRAKRTHYSKKNVSGVEAPNLNPFLPLHLTPQNEMHIRPLQQALVQFPTPTGNISFGSSIGGRQGVILHQYTGGFGPPTSYGCSFIPSVNAKEVSPMLAAQNNAFIQYGSHVYNPIQPGMQSKTIVFKELYESALQNLTAAEQYQNPNQPIYQYGTQHQSILHNQTTETSYWDPNQPMFHYGTVNQPSSQNFPAASQYLDPNLSMYHYGMQHQPSWQNLSAASQHQDPNHSMYQYGMQNEYQPPLQNLTAMSQYQSQEHPIYQYGEQTSYPVNASNEIYNNNIPPPNMNSNILPKQTYATNLNLNSIAQNSPLPHASGDASYSVLGNPNFVPNISNVQTSVESSSPNVSHCSFWPNATMESTNQNQIEDSTQDSNSNTTFQSNENSEPHIYPTWSASTCDPDEETPIDEVDEPSNNQ